MLRLILAVAAALYIVVGAAGAFVARQEPDAGADRTTLEAIRRDLDAAAVLTASADGGAGAPQEAAGSTVDGPMEAPAAAKASAPALIRADAGVDPLPGTAAGTVNGRV